MPRSWDERQDTIARGQGDERPNVGALRNAVEQVGRWSVDDVLMELGGTGRDATHRLAVKLLEARGLDPYDKKNVSSQMRSINRWIAYENGTGSQARKPSASAQQMLNRIGRNAQMAHDGFTVAMSGDIGVAGYRRSNRNASVHMQGEQAAKWLENPTYEGLSQFYDGNDVKGYGDDLQVEII